MRKTQPTTRTGLLFALVLVLVLCLAVAMSPLAQLRADAYTSAPNATVGEIFIDNATTGGSFDRANLEALLDALKATGTTLDDKIASLQTMVSVSHTTSGDGSGNNVTYNNSLAVSTFDSTIIVRFGGIDWIPVLLSLPDNALLSDPGSVGNTPNSGNVILTLWQATGVEGSEKTSTWCDTTVDSGFGTSNQNTNHTYPSNMYSTSKIRNVTLNNGGYYTTNGSTLVQASQSESNTYAKFTMPQYKKEPGGDVSATSKTSKISEFLVAPRYLEWQQNGRIGTDWSWGSPDKNRNNDAWGAQGKNNFYSSDDTYYWYEDRTTGNGTFDAWKDDLIWIPSAAEVGNYYSDRENQGIWKTVQSTQRASSEIAWLRTARTDEYYRAFSLAADGANYVGSVAGSRLVRPALHLNLTAAAKDTGLDKPTCEDKTVTYNGQAQTFDLGLQSEYVTDGKVTLNVTPNDGAATVADNNGTQVLSATKAGTYKVTVTPADGNRWKNDHNSNDVEPIEFTLTISKVPLTITANSAEITYGKESPTVGVTYDGFVNGENENVLNGELKFTYGDYSVGSGVGSYEITPTGLTADNYEIEYKSGRLSVVNADLTLSGEFSFEYEYDLDANGAPVKRELRIAETQVTAANGQKVSFVYGALTATTTGYDASTDGFAVWKVGTYFVDVTISAPNHNEITQRITVTIVKAKPTVTPLCDRSEIWTSGVLPELTCTATLRNNQSVNGAISWITSLGTVRSDGYYDFYYRWVPEDQENFEIVDGNECYVRLYVRFASVTRFTVTFDPEGELFYETDSLNILKNYLTVTVTFSDGTTRTLGMNEYDLNCQGGTTLVAGDSVTVTVSYLSAGTPVERNFNVQVLAVERPVDPDPTPVDPDPAPKDPTGDTISKAKEFFENTPLPLGYAALVLGGMLLLIIILAIAGRKPKKKD